MDVHTDDRALCVLQVSIDGGVSFTASGLHFEFTRAGLVDVTPQSGPVLGTQPPPLWGHSPCPCPCPCV